MHVNDYQISELYNQTNYPIPEKTLTSWSNGVGFDRKEEYSDEDKAKLQKDMNAIRAQFTEEINKSYYSIGAYIPRIGTYVDFALNYVTNTFSHLLKKNAQKWAIISAGAPGAGKTTVLESIRNQSFFKYVYSDPDAVFLKESMKESYQAELAAALQTLKTDASETASVSSSSTTTTSKGDVEKEKQVRQAQYDKWRPASNFFAHYWLATFVKEKLSFYFGTTSSSNQMPDTYKYFKEKGYKIEVINVYAPDAVRVDSIKRRDKEFVQTTDNDIITKGTMVHLRVNDTFHAHADKIQFYYRDKADGAAVHAATWNRGLGVTIYNEEKFTAIVALHKEKAPKEYWPFGGVSAQ